LLSCCLRFRILVGMGQHGHRVENGSGSVSHGGVCGAMLGYSRRLCRPAALEACPGRTVAPVCGNGYPWRQLCHVSALVLQSLLFRIMFLQRLLTIEESSWDQSSRLSLISSDNSGINLFSFVVY
jgi:hypothetical protein